VNTSAESLAWIASNYGVPAQRGQRILFAGGLARITGASGPYLRARMLEDCRWAEAGRMVTLHPTWQVEYVPNEATR
jgi:hypothetical protein